MISSLRNLFGREPPVTGVLETKEPLELATAALLLELARSDFSESPEEVEAIRHLLERRFGLRDEALDSLIEDAQRRADTAVSLHEFTHRLNRELPEEDKLAIIEMLWRVSHADGRIDKHEEHLIRRVAGLLHVSDRDRVRLKLKVIVGD
ncbi:MAG: TerB family tellurite resistance protein [Xanthomonadaceae bacterium]|nr:TerB family tellurite resistance protein [Xanthomonadaceae bacterium]